MNSIFYGNSILIKRRIDIFPKENKLFLIICNSFSYKNQYYIPFIIRKNNYFKHLHLSNNLSFCSLPSLKIKLSNTQEMFNQFFLLPTFSFQFPFKNSIEFLKSRVGFVNLIVNYNLSESEINLTKILLILLHSIKFKTNWKNSKAKTFKSLIYSKSE